MSQKLATQTTELTVHEQQVESLTAELHGAHEAAMSHSAEVLHLQFKLGTHAAISQHEADEASWSVLRAKLTCQAEHMHQLKVAHSCAMAELSIQRMAHGH